MSGVSIHGNVVFGYENGVFVHFGRTNDIKNNLFINCGITVAVEDCEAANTFCAVPLQEPTNP